MQTEILPHLGIKINDIKVTQLNDHDIDNLLEYYHQYHLLVIKDQILDEDELIKASQLFGKPVRSVLPTFRLPNYPVITKQTNVKDENKSPTGAIAPENVYHSDSYFSVNPSKATLLYSLRSPKVGGETHFINMCAVYDALDAVTIKQIEMKHVMYKNVYINQPCVIHPLIRVESHTKKKALFVNVHRALGIVDMSENEAQDLIKSLYNFAIKSPFVYKHIWSNGDLLVWNNSTTMHCATQIADAEERLLYRILTESELPVI